jgi:MarR family 2-MHQ and catechol resistance regulon transcriptional repressor
VRVDERSELAEEFFLFIGAIMRGTRAIFRSELEENDVTWPQFHLLKMVKHRDRTTVTELSNSLMIAAPTASRMIDGLCTKGLLRKEKDPKDHRVTLVVLTRKSKVLLDDLLRAQSEVMADVFAGEDTSELARNMKSLGRISGKWLAIAEKKTRKGEKNE